MTKGQFGHSDDIVSLAMTEDRNLVATGQVGLEPMIFVWDASTAERVSLMTLRKGARSVSALAFSPNGKYLAAADMSDDHAVHVFDLESQDNKGKCVELFGKDGKKSDRQKVFMIQWNPNSTEFATVGVKHFCVWTLSSTDLKYKKGAISSIKTPPGKSMGFSSVAWSKKMSAYLAGGSDGKIYFWKGATIGKNEPAHKKMVSAINVCENENDGSELVISGSSDKTVKVYSNSGTKLQLLYTH